MTGRHPSYGDKVYLQSGKRVGKLRGAIIAPEWKEVTHYIIERGWLDKELIIVPADKISGSDHQPGIIYVPYNQAEFSDLPRFEKDRFVRLRLQGPPGWVDDFNARKTKARDRLYLAAPGKNLVLLPTHYRWLDEANLDLATEKDGSLLTTVQVRRKMRISGPGGWQGKLNGLLAAKAAPEKPLFLVMSPGPGAAFTSDLVVPVEWVEGVDQGADEIRLLAGPEQLTTLPEFEMASSNSERDRYLKREIMQGLADDPFIAEDYLDVEVINGFVTLNGWVRTERDHRTIFEVVNQSAEKAWRIVDRLVVGEKLEQTARQALNQDPATVAYATQVRVTATPISLVINGKVPDEAARKAVIALLGTALPSLNVIARLEVAPAQKAERVSV